MNTKVSFDCVAAWWKDLTDLQKDAFANNPQKVSTYLDLRVKEIEDSTFVIPLSDEEAVQLLVQRRFARRSEAQAIVKSWRKYGSGMGYNGPVAWKVKQGFTLKIHAPLVGPCYNQLEYLQNWNFADTPTADCLVFWAPRLAKQSTGKNVTQMEACRDEQRRIHNLPAAHCDRFGSIQLLFALILAHFKRTGERVPLNYLYAASDTLNADGNRLIAGNFDERGLHGGFWHDSVGDDYIGFFLLGVEKLGQPAQALAR